MICIPITSDNPKEALHAIERSCQLADFLELRMDLIGNIGLAELISAVRAESAAVKIIVTSRKKKRRLLSEDGRGVETPAAKRGIK